MVPDDQELTGSGADGWQVIHRYTRAQAIADGVLIDASETASEAGFKVPVALTQAVWEQCVDWPDSEPTPQDESGRLWDVLFMAHWAALASPPPDPGTFEIRMAFEVYVVPKGGTEPQPTTLSLHAGPGDDGEPVVTILLPNED